MKRLQQILINHSLSEPSDFTTTTITQSASKPVSSEDDWVLVKENEAPDSEDSFQKIEDFLQLLVLPVIDLEKLHVLCRKGVPSELRDVTWKLLLGYLSPDKKNRKELLGKKREHYWQLVDKHFNQVDSPENKVIRNQIVLDVPRTHPNGFLTFFSTKTIQKVLERILYIFAISHPNRNYWQGLNDLPTPFLIVFSAFSFGCRLDDLNNLTEDQLETGFELGNIEADVYGCLCSLFNLIKDNYVVLEDGTISMEGSQFFISKLKQMLGLIDFPLLQYMEREQVEFLHFSFRWLLCLLLREISIKNVLRVWDVYFSEKKGFFLLHAATCANLLATWSKELQRLEFDEIVLFLQNLPSLKWKQKQVVQLMEKACTTKISYLSYLALQVAYISILVVLILTIVQAYKLVIAAVLAILCLRNV
jgi:hypothetical protein